MNNPVIKSIEEAAALADKLRAGKRKIVFTNGVFDIIHRGHIEYLSEAKSMGDVLIVGLNSDSSVKLIKGDKRPIVGQDSRAIVLANLKPVDYVIIFDEDNPYNLIKAVLPDVLVKGADWSVNKIVGSDIVLGNGGEVKNIKFVENNSSTNIVEEIIRKYCK